MDKGLQSMGFSVGGDGESVTHVFARRYYVSGLYMGKGWREGKASEKSENPPPFGRLPLLKGSEMHGDRA